MCSDEKQKHIEAINRIAEYCQEQMPDGWCLGLHFKANECFVTLSDADGDEHEGWESGDSEPVIDACDYAMHTQLEYEAEDRHDAIGLGGESI